MQEIGFQEAVNYDDALWRAAAECAVDASYWDIFGKQHHIDRDGLRAIMQALGWDVTTFECLEKQRRKRFEDLAGATVPQTCVISEKDKWVPLSIPSGGRNGSICYDLALESGHALAGSIDTQQLREIHTTVLDGRRWSTLRLDLPAEVPLGYHTLTVTIDGHAAKPSHVIVCPDRAYLPPDLEHGGRSAGFNVTLYGLRSERNWGCGDFTDLQKLVEWARNEAGFSFIGLNPLHALHNRTPYNTSPYLPLSMYYKNLIYIDIERVEEFRSSQAAQAFASSNNVSAKIRQLRDSEYVEYAEVACLKRRFLKLLYREFRRSIGEKAARAKAFAAYCEREGDLLSNFALYSALDEALHKRDGNLWTWRDWPNQYRSPQTPESQAFAHAHPRSVEFYKYIQFVIEEQLAAAQQHARNCGMSIGLYHDLAVATDNCGSDLWANPDHYVAGCRVGAPPDDFSPGGQDWGFPPPNKEAHRAEGYRLYRESIRKIVRHGGALRIDHVMRLYRLFWVPEGLSPAHGTYVRDYANDLMHVLALESVCSKNIIIGEDLGTVTDEMRELFTRFGILSYRLFPFEKNYQTGEFKHSWTYPRQALVSSATHDLPTLAGFWLGSDIEARKQAGRLDESGYRDQWNDRRREKQRMLDILHSENLLPPGYTRDASTVHQLDGDLHNAIVGFLAQVPSLLLLLNGEDFTKETHQQNLPGTTAEYPNWQRKMLVRVEDLSRPEFRPYTQMFRDQLNRTNR